MNQLGDIEILSRAQFGFTMAFHIIFPTLNLGLALFISIIEGIWLASRKSVYINIAKFWTKIFALTFGMGVVSGLVLSYELGTNFSGFTEKVGPVLGPLFQYEVLSAFFLEAGFLGIMLFGWGKVKPSIHFMATLLVTIGTAISAFWIMSANSWMQTPSGYDIEQGKFIVTSWWHVIFNPSFSYRFIHMLFASYITTCFVVAGISSYYLLKNKFQPVARRCLSIAMWGALILTPLQVLLGDMVGISVHEHQPLKTAAMEGVWNTGPSKPLLLFAIPNQEAQKNEYALSIPYGASLINTHSFHGVLVGLKSVPKADQPIVASVFFSFRVMVGIGVLLFLVAITALWLRWRGRLHSTAWFHRACILAAPLGFFATISGWMTAEFGRQPWVVYGVIRTADAVSPITLEQVAISLSLFVLVYGIVFGFYLYYLFKIIRQGPAEKIAETPEIHAFQYMTSHTRNGAPPKK